MKRDISALRPVRNPLRAIARILAAALAAAAPYLPNEAAAQTAQQAPIYIVNGVRMTEAQVKDIDPSDIVTNTLLPADEHTIAEYGDEANNGVVIITLRYDTPARFEPDGEETSYSLYIGRHVKWDPESDPVARVIISFTVCPDGSVTVKDVLEATDQRLRRRILKAIEEGPRWIPAMKDGQGVATDHVLRITLPEGRRLPRVREIAI